MTESIGACRLQAGFSPPSGSSMASGGAAWFNCGDASNTVMVDLALGVLRPWARELFYMQAVETEVFTIHSCLSLPAFSIMGIEPKDVGQVFVCGGSDARGNKDC